MALCRTVVKFQFFFHAEILRELLNDTTEIWVCGVYSNHLCVVSLNLKSQSLVLSQKTSVLTNENTGNI